jgi:hypothetical protein
MNESDHILSGWKRSRPLPSHQKVRASENEDRVFEVSVAENRVVCAWKSTTSEAGRTDHRHRTRLEVVALMLGYIRQVRSGNGSEDEAHLSQLILRHDALGRPVIFLGRERGPSVSFSYSHGIVWGALCEEGSLCGIDSARGDEFAPGYPFERAFSEKELAQAVKTMTTNRGEVAAALWSAKEAVVKAIGCGFNLVDPLEVTIRPAIVYSDEFQGHGIVSERVLSRVPLRGPVFQVRTFRHEHDWVSVAIAPLLDG